jgi:hypothetical protein
MLDALEALGKVVEGAFGLRYVVSATYRDQVHKRWKTEPKFAIFLEIFETVISLIMLFVVLYIIYSIVLGS